MALTAAQIEERKGRIGASDVASIMGLPTFRGRNAYSTWLEKTDQLEPEKQASAAIRAGNRLEPVVLDYAESVFGPLKRGVVVPDPQGGPLVAMLDAQVIEDRRPVEAKTSGIEGPLHGTWGDEGTSDVPDGYIIQCQTQIACTGAEVCELVALLGGRGFCHFTIEPMDGLIRQIRAITDDFWESFIKPKVDPRGKWADRLRTAHGVALDGDPCEPVLETVKRFRKTPKKLITFANPDAVIDWQAKRQARLDAQKAEDAAHAVVLADLGDAEAAEVVGAGQVTYYEQNGAATIDRHAMKADGVYEKYATANRFRVLRFKRVK